MVTLNPMADPAEGQNEPRRRRLLTRFSLRFLLLGVTICSISFAWVAFSTKRQKAAIAALTENGGYVTYAGDAMGQNTKPTFRTRFVVPLTRYVDTDLLLPVTEVRTRYLEEPSLKRGATYAPPDVIYSVSEFPSVERVRLTHSEIKNEHLVALSGLRHLRHLNLSMTRLHEGKLTPIASLDLISLNLKRTRVDDEGLKCLVGMTNLEYLNVTRTKVTGHGLQYIESLPQLKTLYMQRCLVTREDYERFKETRPDITVKWSALM
ncbi:leucine-rich repeat domain-containing protein [Rhodopirellula bahusiensis]|uniref:leucine-rich repeat domain-containing protein n=1 Tax=Rhodopirellula bahusiensis TaxID=2014065 RepID=UPI003265901B